MEKKNFDILHQHHDQSRTPGLEDCPECRADTIRMILRRLQHGDDKFDMLKEEMEANTKVTRENSETLKDVREIVVMGRSLFKMAGALGNLIKWVGGTVVAGAAAWAVVEKWFPWNK